MYTENAGIVGFGNLGSAIYQVLRDKGIKLLVNNGSLERTVEKLQVSGCDITHAATLDTLVKECSVIFLCIKASQLTHVALQMNHLLRPEHLVFSCLAMESLQVVQKELAYADPIIVKIMPTLGVFNGNGLVAYQLPCFSSYAIREKVLETLSCIVAREYLYEMDTEEQMGYFTIYVACMPGILAHFINLFNWRIVKEEPEVFGWYTDSLSQQLRSTADLIELAGSPKALWEKVATPGGVTRAMTDILGKGGLSSTIQEAIDVALTHMNRTKK